MSKVPVDVKILFTHRFFWPDTAPYGTFLREIAEDAAQQGHDVSVFTSRPSYQGSETTRHLQSEGASPVRLRRCWVFANEKSFMLKRLANVLLYCNGLFWTILRERPNVVTASTFPPVIAGATASFAARIVGAKFVYHLQDIHPEVSRISGGLLGRGLIYRILRWLDTRTVRCATRIIVLSKDMAATIQARVDSELDTIRVINNFSLEATALDEPDISHDGKRRIIFAGNMGRFQDLPLLAEGVSKLFDTHPDLELLFLGDGSAKPELMKAWVDHPQVRFLPFMPFQQARTHIQSADIGLVSLLPDMTTVAYPSKLLTYLGLGLPVLALVEPESELAKDLLAGGTGVVPQSRTADAIATALSDALKNSELKTNAAKHTADAQKHATLSRWRQLLGELS